MLTARTLVMVANWVPMAAASEMIRGKRASDRSASPALSQVDVARIADRMRMIRPSVRSGQLTERTASILLRRRGSVVRLDDQGGVIGVAHQLARSLAALGSGRHRLDGAGRRLPHLSFELCPLPLDALRFRAGAEFAGATFAVHSTDLTAAILLDTDRVREALYSKSACLPSSGDDLTCPGHT